MYQAENSCIKAPFKVECANCGSHNVEIVAIGYGKLLIACKHCDSRFDEFRYNETEYKESKNAS